LERNIDVAVVEIGTNHPGELEYLCSILEPTHGLLTKHRQGALEFFGSLEGVAKSEGELFLWLAQHMVLVLSMLMINISRGYLRKIRKQ